MKGNMSYKKKILGSAAGISVVAASLLGFAPHADATVTQNKTCTDLGGHLWTAHVTWGDATSADGTISVNPTGFKTSASDTNGVDGYIKTYSAGSTTPIETLTFTDKKFVSGLGNPDWLNFNTANPKSGSGAKVVVNLSDDNDGYGGCTITFDQPTTSYPTAPVTPPPAPVVTSAAEKMGWGTPSAGDEFNYTGAPDVNKWSVFSGAGHSGNGTRNPANVTVNGSVLDMVGKSDGSTGGMSAKFDREGKSGTVAPATDSGRWETRMRVFGASSTAYRASGYHPVLIVWPDAGRDCTTDQQEIDYSESTTDVTTARTYIHYESNTCDDTTKTGSKVIDQRQWHNYAVEWTPSKLTVFIDGDVLYSTTDTTVIPKYASHSTIQLDNFLGTLTESHLQVDWTRYYAI